MGIATLQNRRVETACNCAAAEIGCGKPNALLLGEADHLEIERQVLPSVMQVLRDHQRRQYSEPAIEAPGVRDRVIMRADDQRFGRSGGARITADNIADGVDLGFQSSRAHPVAQLCRGGLVRRRKIAARQAI